MVWRVNAIDDVILTPKAPITRPLLLSAPYGGRAGRRPLSNDFTHSADLLRMPARPSPPRGWVAAGRTCGSGYFCGIQSGEHSNSPSDAAFPCALRSVPLVPQFNSKTFKKARAGGVGVQRHGVKIRRIQLVGDGRRATYIQPQTSPPPQRGGVGGCSTLLNARKLCTSV